MTSYLKLIIYFNYKVEVISICSVPFATARPNVRLSSFFVLLGVSWSDKLVGFFVGHDMADLVEGVLQHNVFVSPQWVHEDQTEVNLNVRKNGFKSVPEPPVSFC